MPLFVLAVAVPVAAMFAAFLVAMVPVAVVVPLGQRGGGDAGRQRKRADNRKGRFILISLVVDAG